MSDNQGTAKFATYGPNRGQSLHIGRYEFVDGICEVPQKEAHTASRILCRYHDVCPASELKERIAEYDAKYAAPEPAKTEPASPPDAKPETPKTPEPPAKTEKTEEPAKDEKPADSGEADDKAEAGDGGEKAGDTSDTGKPEKAEKKAAGGNKKGK